MLVPNQKVEVCWNNTTKKHYMELGYEFTKIRDKFLVNVEDLTPNSREQISVICDYCGNQKMTTFNDYNCSIKKYPYKYSCSECIPVKQKEIRGNKYKEKYFNVFVNKCIENNCVPISTIDDYQNAYSKLYFICSKHGQQCITYNSIKAGSWCIECGHDKGAKKIATPIDKVIKIVESKNNNKIINPEEYINFSTSNLLIRYGCCGKVSTTSLNSLENSDGLCYDCGQKKAKEHIKLSMEEVTKRINSVNNNKLLNPSEYIDNSTINLKILCGECNKNIFITSLANYEYNQKIRCGTCSQRISVPERTTRNILEKYDIKYLPEYKFKDCKDKRPLPFDFYLPEYNILIELDGEHHYHPKWGDEQLKYIQNHDKMKNEYCENNNITLIRIPFWEFDNLEKILIEKLNLPQIVDIELSNGRIFKYKAHKPKE